MAGQPEVSIDVRKMEESLRDGHLRPVLAEGNNPRFNSQLAKMLALHDRKNHDYAEDNNPYSNFEFSANVAGCTEDTVFRVMIGIKLARIKELMSGKTPNHESLDDSIMDLAMYAALWSSYRQ